MGYGLYGSWEVWVIRGRPHLHLLAHDLCLGKGSDINRQPPTTWPHFSTSLWYWMISGQTKEHKWSSISKERRNSLGLTWKNKTQHISTLPSSFTWSRWKSFNAAWQIGDTKKKFATRTRPEVPTAAKIGKILHTIRWIELGLSFTYKEWIHHGALVTVLMEETAALCNKMEATIWWQERICRSQFQRISNMLAMLASSLHLKRQDQCQSGTRDSEMGVPLYGEERTRH